MASAYLLNWVALTLILVGWASRVVLTLIVTQQMYRIYQGQSIQTKSLFRGLKTRFVVWYALCSAGLFVVAALGGLLVWAFGWAIWSLWHVDLTLLVLLILALGYPLYVSWLATTSLLAILPVSRNDRLRGLRQALSWQFARQLYVYYFLRVGLEYGLGAIVLYVGSSVAPGSIWVHLAGSVVLVTPLLFLRTATYTKTVDVMGAAKELEDVLERPRVD
ncbi:hypothetical protein [Amycolatopsis samaneae]|uniref:hypothetical protein n=1 Tax=Amycolatopsis samaneae TaxID=664691 RepID=UPI0036214C00